jgi:hypothetical protein
MSYTKIVVHTLAGSKNYILVGNVPKHIRAALKDKNAAILKEYYGTSYKEIIGGADDSMDDLEELLGLGPGPKKAAKPITAATMTLSDLETEYIYDIVLQDDTCMDLKAKIALISGIPVYCQHVYWLRGQEYNTTYSLLIDGAVTVPDIRAMTGTMAESFIDPLMYESKNYITVRARDTFILATESVYHVHDMRSYNSIIMVSEQELVYYGFVLKYWPMVTLAVFNLYISNVNALSASYPLLDPDPVETARVASFERNIKFPTGKSELTECIFNATIRVATSNTSVNIRNVFDGLVTCADMPEIHAYLTYNRSRYFIKKYHLNSTRFPSVINLRDAIVCMLKLADGPPIYVTVHDNGSYLVKCRWGEESEVTFKNIISILQGPVNTLISRVNELNAPRLALLPLNARTAIYKNMDAALFWKRVINERAFAACIGLLDSLIAARVLQKKETTEDGFFYLFRKGIIRYDTEQINKIIIISSHITLDNQYEYLTSSNILTKWNQLYSGKVMKITHRTVDIRFDINDVYEEEFEVFKKYMDVFVKLIESSPSVTIGFKQPEGMRKLKKLKEEDPVLYNFKKMGSSKGYSKFCQKPRQPVAYNEAEYKALGSPKNVTKYWNFTTKSPMYYGCPAKKYPTLGFVGYDKHPQHFCAPCCNKLTTNTNNKRQQIRDSCMKTHQYTKHHESLKHVVKYGKSLYAGKMSYIHPVLAKTLKTDSLRLVGVAQLSAYDINIIPAITTALGITIEEYIAAVTAYLRPENIDHVLGGSLPRNIVDIIGDAIAGAAKGLVLHSTLQWAEMFVDLTLKIYHTRVFVITGQPNIYTNAFSDRVTNNILITKVEKFYYPVTTEDKQMIFTTEGFINILYQICAQPRTDEISLKDVVRVCEAHQWAIAYSVMNKGNKCYAVIIEVAPGDYAYISIDYILETSFKILGDPMELFPGLKLSTLRKVLNLLGITPTDILYAGKEFIGLRDSTGKHHYAAIPDSLADYDTILPARDVKYNYLAVNSAIVTRAAPHNRLANYGNALYDVLEYRLFLLEFITYVERTTNTEVRAKVREMYNADDFKVHLSKYTKELMTILKDFPEDRAIVQKMFYSHLLGENTIEQIDERFSNIRFTFDNTLMQSLQSLSHGELVNRLRQLAGEFATAGDPTAPLEFPNVYTQCGVDASLQYCRGNKLIVKHLDQCIDILAADVKNELKMQYSMHYVRNNNILEYLTFKNTSDIIEIYELVL